ncbi:hypothetical protein L3X07_13950 [Levilactobacillus brevis]|nr:hypothetical protein [Levilactobacillus brevis]
MDKVQITLEAARHNAGYSQKQVTHIWESTTRRWSLGSETVRMWALKPSSDYRAFIKFRKIIFFWQ